MSTLYIDIENDDDRLLLVGWALNDEDVRVEGPPLPMLDLLADPAVTKVTQGDHDLRWFKMHGYEVAGPWENTQVMAWVLDENQPLDLESLTTRYTPAVVKRKTITQSGGELYFNKRWRLNLYNEWSAAVKWQFAEYNRKDVETLRALHGALLRRLGEDEWEGYWGQEEVPYSRVLLDMECRGLPIDLGATAELAAEVRGLRDASAERLRGMAQLPPPFNLNSPDHVREYLFSRFYALPDRLPMSIDPMPSDTDFEVTKVGHKYIHGQWMALGRGLAPTPPAKKKGQDTEGGKPSTEAKELLYKHGDDPWVREYCLEYKRNDKLLSTYLDSFPGKARNEKGQTYDEAVREVRGGVQQVGDDQAGGLGAPPVLFPELREAGGGAPEEERLRGGDERGGRTAGLRASPGDGGEAGRGGTSHQWGPSGQPGGEPDGVLLAQRASAAPLGEFRLYGQFVQTGTVTGRLSSRDPNLQNIPARREMGKRVRAVFKGQFVIGDYDALEMRLMAHFSRDPKLVKVFERGDDPHLLTAHALFGGKYDHDSAERDVAKMVNYAIGYGSGARTLAVGLTVAGFSTRQAVAKEYLETVRAFYPRLFRWNTATIFRAKELGYVETLGGRLRRLPTFAEAGTAWKQSAYGERQAVNSIVQGSAADILRRVMLALDECLPSALPMVAQVHDELLLEETSDDGPGAGVADWIVRGGGVHWDLSLLKGTDDYAQAVDDRPRRAGEGSGDGGERDGARSYSSQPAVEAGVDVATVVLQEGPQPGRGDVSTAFAPPEAAGGRGADGFRAEGRQDPRLLRVIQAVAEEGHGFDLKVPLRFVPKVCEDWGQK